MNKISKEMILLAAKGNQYATEDLYRLTYSSVYKTAKALIQDNDTVLDIVQDSYVKAFQSLDQLDNPENFLAWIKRITANKAKDYLKKKKPILFSEMASEDGEEIEFRDEDLNHIPEEVLDRKETTRLMDEILGSLSEDQRLAIGLHYYQDMSIKEIAGLMGCSENTVKSRLNYGRKKIEVKVRELEKRGTKLYSLAPLPFLLWLFRMDAEATEIPSAALFKTVTEKCAAGSASSAGAKAAVHTGAKAAAGSGARALTTKIIAGALAVTVAGGGTMLALSDHAHKEREPVQQIESHKQTIPAEVISSEETVLFEEQETTPETESPTVPVTESIPNSADAYGQIMLEFTAACAVDSRQWLSNQERIFQYGNLNTNRLDQYHQYGQMAFYYTYNDLDGNGVEELLISQLHQLEPRHTIIGIYSFDGAEAVEIFECGDNNIADVCADGRVMLTEGTILNGTSYVCSIGADGVYPEIIAQHTYDLYEDTY